MGAAAPAPGIGFELDPLIAEAKRRARRRRWLFAFGVAAAAAVVGTAYGTRSSANSLGVCATPPSGWKERTLPRTSVTPGYVVLTNFHFGISPPSVFGLPTNDLRWPRDGVMVAVWNYGPSATPNFSRMLRVAAVDFGGFEGARFPFAQVAVRSGGRVLAGYVEARSVTPATVAAANAALAGVRTCSK